MSTPSHDATFQKTLFGVGVQETSRSQDDLLHPRLEVDLQYSGSGPAGTTGSGATFRLDNTAFNQDIIRERILHLEASENAKHAEILRRDIRDAERERKTAQLEVTCENYRSRIVDLEHMLIQRNEALSENQRQMTTLNDALDDTLVELNKARVLQATAEQKRDEYALEIKHMHRESEKWSQEKAQLEARLQDLQLLNARLQDTRSTEAEWRLQLLERHATQAARIGELWALVTNHETLRTRDADDISTQTDVVYNEADVTYNEAGVFTNKTGIIYNETDVIYTELRALIANCETLQMSGIQVPGSQFNAPVAPRVQDLQTPPRRPKSSNTGIPTRSATRRTRFTMTKSGAPQCRQCDTVFTDREPYTVPCRFHAHAPVLYKILHKQEDPTDADPPMSDKLLFWPCCQKRGTVVPVGCRQLKFHDIPGEETDRD